MGCPFAAATSADNCALQFFLGRRRPFLKLFFKRSLALAFLLFSASVRKGSSDVIGLLVDRLLPDLLAFWGSSHFERSLEF
jgi:hypothetical protein